VTRRYAPALAWTLAVLACGCTRLDSPLMPVGDQAVAIKQVWDLMLWICVPMYLLVMLALAGALLFGRSRGRAVPSDRRMTVGLAAFALLVTGLLTTLTAASYIAERQLHAPVVAPLNIRITAKQWWWQVEYLDADPSRNLVTANELHLPVDRPARIELRTTDVIHSLWIPVLNGKEDMIPGHANVIVMTPRKTGTYRGQCAEFCGLQHANMALDVRVDDAATFAAWRARQQSPARVPATPEAVAGQQLFAAGPCALCHAIQGTTAGGTSGPDLTHLASRRMLAAGALPLNRGTLAAWLIDPQRHKPGTNMPAVPMEPQQLADMVDYLMGLE
jgi:cytochrome c oxidase subunit 2